ncbi:alpha-mannosidase [Cohnella cellulosilytica]|uniref:Alpha-mannosidase n=1 Tax=Cohnella cellulosilytica TaxID=986710 RepID=A0ABW2FFW9_9BACL
MPYETKTIMMGRAKQTLEVIRERVYTKIASLEVNAWRTPEPVPFERRTSGEPIALRPGDKWGELWDCAWFRFSGSVPADAAGCKVVLLIDVNGELCLVDENGAPVQGLTNVNSEFDFSLGLPGKRVVDVTDCARGGEAIDLWADAGCNDLFGLYRSGTLKEADIAICHEETRRLFYDYEVLLELAEQLPENSARRNRLLHKLYEASYVLENADDGAVAAARELLRTELDKKGGDPDVTVSAIGHAHIDLAWLWPIRETIRKGARTFSTVLRNMEKYPDYVFGASQPQLYQWMKEHYPKLYGRIKEKISEGRWEVQGAMWVEPDSNVSGGEALVRQILYGKRFFKQEFGEDVRMLWVPDIFGYSASLPQLLKKAGVDYVMTQKLSWSVYNDHPHHSFLWEGIDGTKVLTHLPPEDTYNSPAAPRSLAKIEREYLDSGVSGHALMLYGIGDGGGGPGEEHLERLERLRNLQGLVPVVQEPSIAFFRKLEQEQERFETWRGELYLEKHQGTLTSQARNKWYNRKLEKALREVEFAASLALSLGAEASVYPQAELETIWKETLLYQFHDILPGSSIGRVYDESLERYAALYERTLELTEEAYAAAAAHAGLEPGEAFVANSLPWERREWVSWNGQAFLVTVPPMSVAPLERSVSEASPAAPVADENGLENELLRVKLGSDGSIVSLYDKLAGRETVAAGEQANLLTVYHDRGDAWDFDRNYRQAVAGRMTRESVTAYENGSEAVVEQRFRFGESTLTQKIVLRAGERIVRFETEADWRESGKMLRASFPVDVRADRVNCEIQFGSLQRQTHRNTRHDFAKDEICAHQYIDLSQPDYGVSLLNDSKYGFSALGSVLDIHLLRSPSYPDPRADRAVHRFVYALYPHEGDYVAANTYRRGYELNSPLTAFAGGKGERRQAGAVPSPFVRIDSPRIMLEAVKKAEDSDDLIVRLYETSGTRAEAVLSFGAAYAAIDEVDLMENPVAGLGENTDTAKLTFGPFEIRTLRLRKAARS